MQFIKKFIEKSILASDLKSKRKIYLAMGKTQQSFNNIIDDGDMKLSDFVKFCEITKVNPADLFEDEARKLVRQTSDCEGKLIKAYELLIKHGIKFDFSE
jgi:hypothetical protein